MPADHTRLPPQSDKRAAWFSAHQPSYLVAWFVVAALLVYMAPTGVRLLALPWTLEPPLETQAWHWTLAFLIAAFGATLARATGSLTTIRMVLLAVVPWAVAAATLVIRPETPVSRVIALASWLLGTALLILPQWSSPTVLRVATGLGLAGAVLATQLPLLTQDQEPPQASMTTTLVPSALYPVTLTYQPVVPAQEVHGGALAPFHQGILLVTAIGEWFELTWDDRSRKLVSRRLSIPAPMARDSVVVDAGNARPMMRVTSLAIDTTGGGVTAYAAHEVWHVAERCVSLRVSAISLASDGAPSSAWRPMYTSQPCLKPAPGFDPYEVSGHIVLQPDHSILLSVGDYGRSAAGRDSSAQRPDSDLGKILRIGRDGSRSIHSSGHRNVAGITADLSGRLWVTEHGPRGGDEVNLLRQGGNYGWPLATYGTDYGTYAWPISPATGDHSGFEEPNFVFVPSVGISSVIVVRGETFSGWRGDLLAGSLKDQQLFRIRLRSDRGLYAEPIRIGKRIRDLVEDASGRIILWTDDGQVISLIPDLEIAAGATAFQICSRCHGINGRGTRNGPDLSGVIGRSLASAPEFEYSEALKRLGGTWSRQRLDAFLRDPGAFAPGTTMQFPVPDSAVRARIVEYLSRSVR